MDKLARFISRKYIDLIFSLFCGLNYFIVVMNFVLKNTNNGHLLGLFFFPAIVCGIGLVILKLIKQWAEQNEYRKIGILTILHLALFVMNAFLIASILITL